MLATIAYWLIIIELSLVVLLILANILFKRSENKHNSGRIYTNTNSIQKEGNKK